MYAYLEAPLKQSPNPPLQYSHTHTRGYFRSRAPDRASRSINYISAPAIKQGYYQAATHRPGKARPIKGCCDVGAGTRSCDSNTEWQLMLSGERRMERGKTQLWPDSKRKKKKRKREKKEKKLTEGEGPEQ